MKFFARQLKKGSAIYIALITMSIILAIGLGLGTLILGNLNLAQGMGESVLAFYAADAGIEALFGVEHCFDNNPEGADRNNCITNLLGISSVSCAGSTVPDKISCLQNAFQAHEDAGENKLANEASYSICKNPGVPGECFIVPSGVAACSPSGGANYCATSKGTFTGAYGKVSQRAIQISR